MGGGELPCSWGWWESKTAEMETHITIYHWYIG